MCTEVLTNVVPRSLFEKTATTGSASRLKAARVKGLSRLHIAQVAMGFHHMAAVSRDGRVFTWGTGLLGHGHAATPAHDTIAAPAQVDGVRQAVDVQVSDHHTVIRVAIRIPPPLPPVAIFRYRSAPEAAIPSGAAAGLSNSNHESLVRVTRVLACARMCLCLCRVI
jgi:hypothetical protein